MNTLPKKSKSSAGQALLVAVLAIAVSLIVVLSIIARSVTDVAVSNKEDESLRAFSAAEAGVEKALIMGSDQSGGFANAASFVAKVIPTQGSTEIPPGVGLLSGETMTVWFVSHNADGTPHLSCSDPTNYPCFTGTNMDVCWEKRADETSETIPAIEVSVYYGPTTDIRIYRAAIDPASPIRGSFSPAGSGNCTIGTDTFAYRQNIILPGGKIFAKVRVLYNTDLIMLGVKSPGPVFPSQGTTVTSSGLAGESNRKISVSQSYNEPAAVFEAGIYSGGGLIK